MHYRWYQILQLLFNRKRLTTDIPNNPSPSPTMFEDQLESGPNSRVHTPAMDDDEWVDLHVVNGEEIIVGVEAGVGVKKSEQPLPPRVECKKSRKKHKGVR